MKTTAKLFIIAFFGFILCSAVTKKESQSLKILTYNIFSAKGVDGVIDYNRIADFITSCDLDVAAIQELDSAMERSNGVYMLEEIAKKTGMHYTFRASLERQGGKFGLGILSKEKPVSSKAIALPGRDEARSLLIVEFKDYFMFCTHLSQNGEDRLSSATIINDELKKLSTEKPVFFGGDFNALPSSAPMKELYKSWEVLNDTASYTLPPGKPNRCIDFVLVNRPYKVEVKKAQVFDIPLATWHLPVLVEVEF